MKQELLFPVFLCVVSHAMFGCSKSADNCSQVERDWSGGGTLEKGKNNKVVDPVALPSPFDTNGFKRIEDEISQLHDILLDVRKINPCYVTNVCRMISDVDNVEMRSRLFHQLVECAFSVDLSLIGDVKEPKEEKRVETIRRLGRTCAFWESLVDEIQVSRMLLGDTLEEQFAPMFRYCTAMRAEAKRSGVGEHGLDDKFRDIERMIGFCLKARQYSIEDIERVRAVFRCLAGRDARTLEQIDLDAGIRCAP